MRIRQFVAVLSQSLPVCSHEPRGKGIAAKWMTRHQASTAVDFARAHFPALLASHSAVVASAMAVLASPTDSTEHSAWGDGPWHEDIVQFYSDAAALLAIPATPPLVFVLAAAICVLGTPACCSLRPSAAGTCICERSHLLTPAHMIVRQPRRGDALCTECPRCICPFCHLHCLLPSAHRGRSSLKCRLSGFAINEDNLPTVFPDGHVYCLEALTEPGAHALRRGCSLIDPSSGQFVHPGKLRIAFFL